MQDNLEALPSALQGIFDIEEPAIPAQILFEQNALEIAFILSIVLCVLLLIFVFLRRYYFSARGKAQRQLVLLENKFRRNQIDNPATVYQLSIILCYGLGVQQLSKNMRLPNKILTQKDRWICFVENFSMARYSKKTNDTKQVTLLLDDARHWLTAWPILKRFGKHE